MILLLVYQPVSDNYITTVFDAVKDEKPAWNCDTWVDQDGNQILSLYYVNPDSEKGYGSIYFDKSGKEISVSGVELELVNHYVGKDVSEDTTPAKISADSIPEQHATAQEPATTAQEQNVTAQKQPATTQEQPVTTQESTENKERSWKDDAIFTGTAATVLGGFILYILRLN